MKTQAHTHDGHSGHCHELHCHENSIRRFSAPALSLILLVIGLLSRHFGIDAIASGGATALMWYLMAFLPVGIPVVKDAVEAMRHHDYFNEFTLMIIACAGAFCIGEYAEAVGVMLFYTIGEAFQHAAVERATDDIARLVDVRGDRVEVECEDDRIKEVRPEAVEVGNVIVASPGQRVALDGTLLSKQGVFDTSALTGESLPRTIVSGGEVLAGMISMDRRVRIRVSRPYGESAMARILAMVNEATHRKAHAELFIRRFARVYTPAVIFLALLLVVVPGVVGAFASSFHYDFSEWLYRALVFLVISCPCALVISVPLAYFAGIGAASRAGILFKGGNYLEVMANVRTVAFDKTGTLTTGHFSVVSVVASSASDTMLLRTLAAAEAGSTHPLAKAVVNYAQSLGIDLPTASSIHERPGHGVTATVDGLRVVAGNRTMLESEHIAVPESMGSEMDSVIACGVNGQFAGYVTLADTMKPDAPQAVESLRRLGLSHLAMLSGDRSATVTRCADTLGLDEAHGDMLPADKANYVCHQTEIAGPVAFVGDGMNDAPVLAMSDVGVAMGGLGSDAAIESADVVIQSDMPLRVASAIRIGRATHSIVRQNIAGAIGVKVLVMALGTIGEVSLWAAVFADVGVALLAVLNSMRIMWKKY